MTSQPKEESTGNGKRVWDCDKWAKPLEPERVASIIGAMVTFTVVAELMMSLVDDHSCQHADLIANVLMHINQTRERCNSAYAKSLLSSMPLEEARKEIERLRSYEARILAEKRNEMNAVRRRQSSKLAKRSQRLGAGHINRDVSKIRARPQK